MTKNSQRICFRCAFLMNEMNSQETVVLSDNAVISEDALGYTDCECQIFKRYIAALKIYSTFS